MPKSEIHPKWYPDAKVICNGEVVMTTGSTQPELHVDVWSGNHPFFTGTQKILDTEGRVDRFMKKYGMGSANSATSKEQKEEMEEVEGNNEEVSTVESDEKFDGEEVESSGAEGGDQDQEEEKEDKI